MPLHFWDGSLVWKCGLHTICHDKKQVKICVVQFVLTERVKYSAVECMRDKPRLCLYYPIHNQTVKLIILSIYPPICLALLYLFIM